MILGAKQEQLSPRQRRQKLGARNCDLQARTNPDKRMEMLFVPLNLCFPAIFIQSVLLLSMAGYLGRRLTLNASLHRQFLAKVWTIIYFWKALDVYFPTQLEARHFEFCSSRKSTLSEGRKSWASDYLRDKFCAGFRTISRCEAINNFIKRFICIRQSLLELVQDFEHALRDYRNNVLVSQFKTLYREPILITGLEALELSAANFYTREILGEVKKEIQGVVALDVINEENISTIVVLKVKECDRRQQIYNVLYDHNTEHIECECSRWGSEGIPCSHMFCAMKMVGLQKLPDSLLLKRWSKDAKKYLDESSAGGTMQDKERKFLMRYSALSVAATWMVFLGAQDGPSFHDTMNEVCRWTQTLEQKSGLKRQTRDSPTPNFVGDPSVVKTKGAPKGKKERGKRRCTKCNSAGHVKNKCPVSNDGDDLRDKTGSGE
ncbi:hypothetical protein AHAS_Ahas16G0172600 [Arachis hypogaea]